MSKRIVIAFGRFNPPTTGHKALLDYGQELAKKERADFVVFPTLTEDKATDPLPFFVKLSYLRALWPTVTFNGNQKIRTIVDALRMISRRYREATLVVGSDRANDFERLRKYIVPKRRRATDIALTRFTVAAVKGLRDADSDDVEGMSASKMRRYAIENDFASFREGVPTTNDRLAERLFTSVRRYMGIKESKGRAFLLYGTSPVAVAPLREAFVNIDRKLWRDVTGKTFSEIRRLYQMAEAKGYVVTIYTRDLPLMTESVVKHKSTLGLLKESFARDLVDIQHVNPIEAAHWTGHHLHRLIDEATVVKKPKPPSEVDKLRLSQQRELLLTKQRQGQELLAAKQRELTKKTQDASRKIANKK